MRLVSTSTGGPTSSTRTTRRKASTTRKRSQQSSVGKTTWIAPTNSCGNSGAKSESLSISAPSRSVPIRSTPTGWSPGRERKAATCRKGSWRRFSRPISKKAVNVGDPAVLLDIAEEAGLDRALVKRLLESDADKDAVSDEIDAARKMGVAGVPFFIFDQQYALSGAQPVEVLVEALRDIARMKAEELRKLN